MTQQAYAITTSVLFALVAVLHLLRFFLQWEITVDGWNVPLWVSVIAVIVAGYLSVEGYRVTKRIGA